MRQQIGLTDKRMVRITWIKHVINREVSRKTDTKRTLRIRRIVENTSARNEERMVGKFDNHGVILNARNKEKK